MDAFFASVEQLDNPSLQGKPVIVGGIGKRGVVCTASYEARKYGVHSAMSGIKAHQLCPQGIFLPVRHDRYREVSNRIFTIFHQFSPKVEPLSIDEAFLDLTGMELIYHHALKQYAVNLKKQIFSKTGIHASIGIAPNKFIAKMASDLKKPDGLVIVEAKDVQSFLADLPIKKLWGVGARTAQKLYAAGFFKISDIANANLDKLIALLGDKNATHLYQMANGIDKREVQDDKETKSVSSEETYIEDIQSEALIKKNFLSLAETVGWRLRQKELKAKTISIKVRTDKFTTYNKSITLPEGTNFDNALYKAAIKLFAGMHLHGKIRLLGISGSNFSAIEEQSLFTSTNSEKQRKLYNAIDSIKARFGTHSITKAQLLKRKNKGESK